MLNKNHSVIWTIKRISVSPGYFGRIPDGINTLSSVSLHYVRRKKGMILISYLIPFLTTEAETQ